MSLTLAAESPRGLEGRSVRGAVDDDKLAGVASLGRLLAGVIGDEAALLAATCASNCATDRRSRPGIWEDEDMELGGGDDLDASGPVMVSLSSS